MIKNIPNPDNFLFAGIDCLLQAYKNIFSIDTRDWGEIPRNEIWKYNRTVLKSSVILLHQGLELLLKAEIVKMSPLLLIDNKRSDWKTLPSCKDEDFSDLYTIGGDALLRTFFACVSKDAIRPEFTKHFELVRVKRNKIMHGTGKGLISPKEVISLVLWSFTFILGEDSFWHNFNENFYNHPGHYFGQYEMDFEESSRYEHLDYLEAVLGPGELNNHFSINIKSRRFYCPDCAAQSGMLVSPKGAPAPIKPASSKWAFLNPNNARSTNITCLVCELDFEVERIYCNPLDTELIPNGPCKGNVISFEEEGEIDEDSGDIIEEDLYVCLTCYAQQK